MGHSTGAKAQAQAVAGTAVVLYSSALSGLFLLYLVSYYHSCCAAFCRLAISMAIYQLYSRSKGHYCCLWISYTSFSFVAFTTTQHFSWPLLECEFVYLVFDLDIAFEPLCAR